MNCRLSNICRFWVLVFAAAFLFLALHGCAAIKGNGDRGRKAGNLTGRFTFEGKPVAHGDVYLARTYPAAEGEEVHSTKTDGEGYFGFFLPPGRYFIYGRKAGDGGIFAFSGQNPLDVGAGERFVGLKGVGDAKPLFENTGEDGGAITGKVTFKGEPVEGAYVYLYSDGSSLYKGPGFAVSAPTDGEGMFYLDNLPETDYVVIGRRRSGGAMTGPLRAGDLYCFYPASPVFVPDGSFARIVLECVEKAKDISYTEVTSGSPISVGGFVVDRFGKPVEGVYAFVYDTRVFGHKRPYSHSGKTGPDGRFRINLDRGGTYYLGSREAFGNTPRPGELFGFYNGTPDHSIEVEPGARIEDLVIVVDRIFEGEGEEGAEPGLKDHIFDRGMPVKAIKEDTTLEGTVLVEGILVVPKGVTVTILPGTKVMFKKIDVDGDGIGDGEFYVEGNLLVGGTEAEPVLFTSAEDDPSPKDWKYLFVNLSSRSQFEHMVSEYAFSGLQIHFSNATVTNCLFRNNVDGLRFSTVRGTFEGNVMKGNVYGVRYEERATKASLTKNLIAGNKVGIFAVLESRGGLLITGNNVENNRSYNFKMGNRQLLDLPVQGNWWGSAQKEKIEESIFDGDDVPGLGKVIYSPFAKEPFSGVPKRAMHENE